ncbi:hypothetical protein BH10ACT8_BH10ACT8_08670 [soil metagenome]
MSSMDTPRAWRRVSVGLLAAVTVTVGLTIGYPQPAVAAAACTGSAPLTRLVLPNNPTVARHAYVAFSAVNSHGTYGGIAGDSNGTFEMLRYDLAQKRVTVLDKATFSPWGDPDSVVAVGVDNSGAVTFKVTHFGPKAATLTGYRYSGGHKYTLWHLPTWTSFEPEGVAADGTIVGEVSLSDGTARAVKWTGTGSGRGWYVSDKNSWGAGIDGRGNIAYNDSAGHISLVTPTGVVRELVNQSGGSVFATHWVTAGAFVYGTGPAGSGSVGLRWRTADAPGTGPIRATATPPIVYGNAAGTGGTLVGVAKGFPSTGPEYYLKPGIPVHHLPAIFNEDNLSDNAPVAVNQSGAVVYTGTDGLPRLVNCTA